MENSNNIPKNPVGGAIPVNIAIVGGGRTCRFFLELIHNDPLPFFDIRILGVCDRNDGAEGILLSEEMGIIYHR